MPIIRSPKDQGNQPHKPHPKRQLVLQDLVDLEGRLPSKKDLADMEERLSVKQDLSKLATKKDLLATEKRLSKLITQARFDWTIGPVTNKVQGKQETMQIKLTNEQQVSVTLKPRTDAGKPAKLDGAPTWEVVSGESTVTAAEDGLSALIVSSDNPGDTQILVKADADIGEGVEEISEILEVTVAGASAKNLGITVGTPENKPLPPE